MHRSAKLNPAPIRSSNDSKAMGLPSHYAQFAGFFQKAEDTSLSREQRLSHYLDAISWLPDNIDLYSSLFIYAKKNKDNAALILKRSQFDFLINMYQGFDLTKILSEASQAKLFSGLQKLIHQALPEALRDFEAAESLHPNHPLIMMLKGITFTFLSQPKEATEHAKRAIDFANFLNPSAYYLFVRPLLNKKITINDLPAYPYLAGLMRYETVFKKSDQIYSQIAAFKKLLAQDQALSNPKSIPYAQAFLDRAKIKIKENPEIAATLCMQARVLHDLPEATLLLAESRYLLALQGLLDRCSAEQTKRGFESAESSLQLAEKSSTHPKKTNIVFEIRIILLKILLSGMEEELHHLISLDQKLRSIPSDLMLNLPSLVGKMIDSVNMKDYRSSIHHFHACWDQLEDYYQKIKQPGTAKIDPLFYSEHKAIGLESKSETPKKESAIATEQATKEAEALAEKIRLDAERLATEKAAKEAEAKALSEKIALEQKAKAAEKARLKAQKIAEEKTLKDAEEKAQKEAEKKETERRITVKSTAKEKLKKDKRKLRLQKKATQFAEKAATAYTEASKAAEAAEQAAQRAIVSAQKTAEASTLRYSLFQTIQKTEAAEQEAKTAANKASKAALQASDAATRVKEIAPLIRSIDDIPKELKACAELLIELQRDNPSDEFYLTGGAALALVRYTQLKEEKNPKAIATFNFNEFTDLDIVTTLPLTKMHRSITQPSTQQKYILIAQQFGAECKEITIEEDRLTLKPQSQLISSTLPTREFSTLSLVDTKKRSVIQRFNHISFCHDPDILRKGLKYDAHLRDHPISAMHVKFLEVGKAEVIDYTHLGFTHAKARPIRVEILGKDEKEKAQKLKQDPIQIIRLFYKLAKLEGTTSDQDEKLVMQVLKENPSLFKDCDKLASWVDRLKTQLTKVQYHSFINKITQLGILAALPEPIARGLTSSDSPVLFKTSYRQTNSPTFPPSPTSPYRPGS